MADARPPVPRMASSLTVGKLLIELLLESGQFTAEMTKAEGTIQSKAASMGKVMTAAGAAMAAGLAVAAAAATAASVAVIKVGSDFEQAMTTLGAIAEAAPGSAAFQALENQARLLGETTLYSAKQAAEGLTELKKAGLDVEQAIAASDDVIALAGAHQLELGRASSIVAAALTQFKISADDAGRVTDVLSTAANLSLASVDSLAEALKFAGPVAAGFGNDLEETTAVLSEFTNLGIDAGLAGRALRSGLASLTQQNEDQVAVLKELNVQFSEINPETTGLIGIMERLGAAGMTMTQAMTLFGSEAGGAFSSLATGVQNGTVQLRETEMALRNAAGSTAELYATMLDTLQSQGKLTFNKLQELMITAFEAVEGPLKDVVAAVGTLIDQSKGLVLAEMPRLQAAVGDLLGALQKFITDDGPGAVALMLRLAEVTLELASSLVKVVDFFSEMLGVVGELFPVLKLFSDGTASGAQISRDAGTAIEQLTAKYNENATTLDELYARQANGTTAYDNEIKAVEAANQALLTRISILQTAIDKQNDVGIDTFVGPTAPEPKKKKAPTKPTDDEAKKALDKAKAELESYWKWYDGVNDAALANDQARLDAWLAGQVTYADQRVGVGKQLQIDLAELDNEMAAAQREVASDEQLNAEQKDAAIAAIAAEYAGKRVQAEADASAAIGEINQAEYDEWSAMADEKEKRQKALVAELEGQLGVMGKLLKFAREYGPLTLEQEIALGKQLVVVTKAWDAMADAIGGVKSAVASAVDYGIGKLADLTETLTGFTTSLSDAISLATGSESVAGSTNRGTSTTAYTSTSSTAVAAAVQTQVDEALAFAQSLASNIGLVVTAIAQKMPEIIQAAANAIGPLIEALASNMDEIIQAIAVGMVVVAQALAEHAPALLQAIVDNLGILIAGLVKAATTLVVALIKALPDLIESLVAQIPYIVETLVAGLATALVALMKKGGDILVALLDAVVVLVTEVVANVDVIVKAFVKGLMGPGGLLYQMPAIALELVKATVELTWMIVAVLPYQIVKGVVDALPMVWQGLKDAVGDFWTWLGEEVWTTLKGVFEDLAEILTLGLVDGEKDGFLGAENDKNNLWDAAFEIGTGSLAKTDWGDGEVEGSHASGARMIGKEGTYRLHPGEAVVPADMNPWNPGAAGGSGKSNGGGMGTSTTMDVNLFVDSRLVDGCLVTGGRRGHTPGLHQQMKKGRNTRMGLDRRNFSLYGK